MTIAVRSPTTSDIDGVFACLLDYRVHLLGDGASADPDFPDDAILSVRNQISEIDLATHSFVASNDHEVLGFCCWAWSDESARHAKTVLISVRESARGLGVGSLLQQARMEEMWDAGAVEIHTWSDDPRAIAWYERHFGYRITGREPIRHSLHRFRWDERSWWALHRGFPDREELVHLVLSPDAARQHTEEHR